MGEGKREGVRGWMMRGARVDDGRVKGRGGEKV